MIAVPGLHRPTVPAHPDDAVCFAGMTARGDDLAVRRWVHHLFLPSQSAAFKATRTLRAQGWRVQLLAAMPEPAPGWRLRLYRDTVVDAAQLNRARSQMVRAAREVGGTYDGWDDHPLPVEALRRTA